MSRIQSKGGGVTVKVNAGFSKDHNCDTTSFIVSYSGDSKTHDHIVISDKGETIYNEQYRSNKK